jgi:hypothetical protein
MRLQFEDCTVDLGARELRRGGEPVSLSPRAFRLLELLLESRPRARSQQSLREALWPDTVVGYTSLAQLVTEVRRALGDHAEQETSFAGSFVSEDREFLIPIGSAFVGRGETCRVRMRSPLVSRVHARVQASDGRVLVEDAGSKNGTWVNGTRIAGPVPLAEGDELAFGLFRVVFHAAASAAPTRTGRPR